jgi:hypothetical protein
VSAGFFDVALGALHLAVVFVVSFFLPILVQLLLLLAAGWALKALAERASLSIALLLSLIGVPIHEFSHAIGFLITFSGVAAIKPLFDELGYAFVAPRRPYCWGYLVASIAPLFGATAVLWLIAIYVIPDFSVTPVTYTEVDAATANWAATLTAAMDYVDLVLRNAFSQLSTLQWGNWRTYLGLYIAISVAIGLAPSSVDWRIFFASLPLAVLLVLALFAWLYVSGDAVAQFQALKETVMPHLLTFSTVVMYAFVLTILGALIFLPFGLWAGLRGK